MNGMHMNSVDLNLLKVAASLYRNMNVSQAAVELGLSQSAVSHALARLRDQFKDPLFVRTSKGVAPTDFARSIENDLLEVVHRAALLVDRKSKFDPSEARGRVTVSSTDFIESVIFPTLVSLLEKEAPHLQLSLRPTRGDLPKEDLENGKIDIAVAGFFSQLPEGFYQSKVGSEDFACAYRKNHSRLGARLSAKDYLESRHALITLQGDFKDDWTKAFSKRGRDIHYGSHSFTGMAWVLAESDLVLTAPRRLLEQYAKYFPIRVVPCPFDAGKVDLLMVWHARTNQDPLRMWFRELFRKACLKALR